MVTYSVWFLSMIAIIYFFVSGGQQSDAGGGFGFCGYILWFMSMIVIICTQLFPFGLSIKVFNIFNALFI